MTHRGDDMELAVEAADPGCSDGSLATWWVSDFSEDPIGSVLAVCDFKDNAELIVEYITYLRDERAYLLAELEQLRGRTHVDALNGTRVLEITS